MLVEKPKASELSGTALKSSQAPSSVTQELMPPVMPESKEQQIEITTVTTSKRPTPPADQATNTPVQPPQINNDPDLSKENQEKIVEMQERTMVKKIESPERKPVETVATLASVKQPQSTRTKPILSPKSSNFSPTLDIEKLQQQIKKQKAEFRKSQTEARQLRKHVMQLNKDLEASESEVKAQRDELNRAGERMEKERLRMNEDREELMDEHDEELDTQKRQFEKLLAEEKERLKDKIDALEQRLEQEEDQRRQEGGDWNKELEEAIQRERETLKKLSTVNEDSVKLKSSVAKLETQQSALQTRVESLTQASQSALERERKLQDKLDSTLSTHSRQLNQRKAREVELECNVADLGAVLASSRKARSAVPVSPDQDVSLQLREKYLAAAEEMESLRAQLSMEMERSEALRLELDEISRERNSELAEIRTMQQEHDKETFEMQKAVAKLEASLRDKRQTHEISGEIDIEAVARELEEAKSQIKTLSTDLLRHQSRTEGSKTEIFALKNRLHAATKRAETAETELSRPQGGGNVYELDSGGVAYDGATMRRRVKGGRGRIARPNQSVRSIRSALNMGPGQINEGPMEQVAITLDAMDGWLLDTCSFMKHEPIARLGLLVYIFVIHFWSFALVLFHSSSYEEVHGEFGSMGDPNVDQNLGTELLKEHQP